ncbi:MAG: ORF6N domain-containing protein [Bacteroidales bacterium]|nr:ORF6N domain-containing protein [Bacteroidales bacterium]
MTENKEEKLMLPDEAIMNKILLIRGERVMIDTDLAELYAVPTKRLNEQVKRNIKRFPKHFMFELTKEEKDELVAKCDHLKKLKHSSFLPNVFTQYGVLQAANVLNSDRAILMSNRIIEVFVRMHEMFSTHKEILQKIEQLIEKDTEQDKKIMLIFEYLKQFEEAKQQQLEQANRKRIGFKTDKE